MFHETLPLAVRYELDRCELNGVPVLLATHTDLSLSGRPGPVVLDIPADVFGQQCPDGSVDCSGDPQAARLPSSRAHPDPEAVAAAARVLADAQRPVIIAGGGVAISDAAAALAAAASASQVPVGTTIAGKGVFPETDPLGIGRIGRRILRQTVDRFPQNGFRVGVGEDVGEPVLGVRRVDRQVHRARLDDAEGGDDELR